MCCNIWAATLIAWPSPTIVSSPSPMAKPLFPAVIPLTTLNTSSSPFLPPCCPHPPHDTPSSRPPPRCAPPPAAVVRPPCPQPSSPFPTSGPKSHSYHRQTTTEPILLSFLPTPVPVPEASPKPNTIEYA